MIESLVYHTRKPWILVTCSSLENVPSDTLMIALDGSSMRNLTDLYKEFVRKFGFPSYFGNNYNALIDCLTDLQWLPSSSYLVVVEHAELLLENEGNDTLQGLLEILCLTGKHWSLPVELGEWWDRKGIPFHTILVFDKDRDLSRFYRRLTNSDLLDLKCL